MLNFSNWIWAVFLIVGMTRPLLADTPPIPLLTGTEALMDGDNDGIPDALDHCPEEMETKNGIDDFDGCPENDRDKDGIADSLDKCPTEAETLNFYKDEDGCPDEKPLPIRNGIVQGIIFRRGTSILISEAMPILDSLARVLQANPGAEGEIQVHNDNVLEPKKNMQLTQSQAETIREYLLRKGIEADRIHATGFGSSTPIAPNNTAERRMQNRRVEFYQTR